MPFLKRQQHDIVLTLFVVAEFGEGFVKRARVQINHEGPQRRTVRIQAGHLALMRVPHLMQSIDHIDVEIKKRIAAGIAIQRIFDQTFRSRHIDVKGLGKFLGLHRFFDAGDPPEIR